LTEILENAEHRVERAITTPDGYIGLYLEGGLLFEARPYEDDFEEAWRVFRPDRDEPHVVFRPHAHDAE